MTAGPHCACPYSVTQSMVRTGLFLWDREREAWVLRACPVHGAVAMRNRSEAVGS